MADRSVRSLQSLWTTKVHSVQFTFDKATSYALCALNRLAHAVPGVPPLTAARIAAECGMPEAVLRKVLHSLGRTGFVAGTRGMGYVLGSRGRSGSVLDVVEALNAMAPGDSGCFVKEGPCLSEDSCPIRHACQEVRAVLRQRLGAIPLSSLPADGQGVPFCFRESAA